MVAHEIAVRVRKVYGAFGAVFGRFERGLEVRFEHPVEFAELDAHGSDALIDSGE